jgi:flagellar protein FlaG
MAIDSISALGSSQLRPAAQPTLASKQQAQATSPFSQELTAAIGPERPAQAVAATEQNLPPGGNPDREAVEQAVSNMNSYVQNLQRDLQFEVDLDLGHTVISVVDRSTNEVIRQIPSEEAVARAQRLQEQLENTGGLLLKVQA